VTPWVDNVTGAEARAAVGSTSVVTIVACFPIKKLTLPKALLNHFNPQHSQGYTPKKTIPSSPRTDRTNGKNITNSQRTPMDPYLRPHQAATKPKKPAAH